MVCPVGYVTDTHSGHSHDTTLCADAICDSAGPDADTCCIACESQTGCAVDGTTCSGVSFAMAKKLVCATADESCTMALGTVVEETVAATTCTLTPATGSAAGSCAVATGSGTCSYVKYALDTKGTVEMDDGEHKAKHCAHILAHPAPMAGLTAWFAEHC